MDGLTRRRFLAQGVAASAAVALGAGREVKAQGMLVANGRLVGPRLAGVQGAWVRLLAHPRATRGLDVTLREEGGGPVWYAGPAAQCDLGFWLIRPGAVALEAVFSRPDGLPQTQRLTLETVAPKAGTLAPGLLLRIIRRGDSPSLPLVKAFRPGPHAVGADPALAPGAADYPPFRTAESVVDPGNGPFRLPDYWHRPIEDLRFGKSAGTLAVPVQDLLRADAAARVEGFLLTDRPGEYGFKLETACSAELLINGRRCLGAERVRLRAGVTPFAVTLARRGEAEPEFALLWRTPDGEGWEPVPPGRFLHLTPAAAESCYEAFAGNLRHRALNFGGAAPDFEEEPPEEPTSEAYRAAAKALVARFVATGEEAAAARLLRWAGAYFTHAHAAYGGPRFLWLQDGALLADAIALRPILEACLRMPALQRQALAVRVAALRNTDPILSRSFLDETHLGTNDGYGEANNFMELAWAAAALWDDPFAYDAARSLYDNHFAYRPDTLDGMESDATFSFHAANGRQLNFGAYGRDWAIRATRFPRAGTPWGESRRQYARVADYVLAYEWVLYRGAMAFCANGRHNEHRGVFPHVFAQRLLALPEGCLEEGTRAALEALLGRVRGGEGAIEGNRFFFRQLLAVHRRKDYYIDVKLTSPLVGGVETFAGANPGNLAFGDGVTTLLRRGDEYRALHRYTIPDALWRFRSLPGTTQLDEEWGSDDKHHGLDRYRAGGGRRAGGVSDGSLGHCGFEFVSHPRNATRARKLFVFLEHGLFVLGGGITGGKAAQAPFSYRSTLNQTAFTDALALRAEDGTEESIPEGTEEAHLSHPLTQRFWVEHAGIGYLILPSAAPEDKDATLHVRVSPRTPLNRLAPHILDDPAPDMVAYKAKCQALADKGRRATVLEIWVDHGTQPTEASVAYLVHMRPEIADPADLLREPPIDLVANTPTCQAVRDDASGTLHAFFYEPGTITVGRLRLTVDKPASLMLRQEGTRVAIVCQDPCVACEKDPAQHAQSLTLTLNGRRHTLRLPGAGDPDDRRRGACLVL